MRNQPVGLIFPVALLPAAGRAYHNTGLDGAFLNTLMPVVVDLMGEIFPELVERREVVATQLRQEEERFARTLNSGTDVAQRELERLKRSGQETVPGSTVFDLYQTHGIPSELLEEFAQEEGLGIDREGFEAALAEERERGQASWRGRAWGWT